MRPKLNIKPYNIFEAYQQRYKEPINPGYMVGQHPVARQNFDTWFKTVPSDRRDISSYNLRRAYELAPMEELEAWRKSSVADLEAGKNHLRSVYENPETGEYEFMKSRNHPTLQYELDWYNGDSKDAKEFRDKYALDTSGEYYKYIPRRQKDSSESSVATALDPLSYTFTGEQLGIEEPVKQQQPVAAPRQTEPKVSGALSGFFSGLSGRRREWPGSANAGRSGAIGYLGSMYTSPEEEERYLRQSQNKTKLMAVADALRQFGNIYYTSRYATPQKFNDIYAQERARYLQDKAIRDKNNVYYAQQKQREAQLEMQRDKIAADAERRNEELAMKREAHKARLPYYTNQAKAAEMAAKIKEMEAKSKPDELKQKSDKRQADIENVNARTAATKQGAADKHANTMDQIRKRGYTGSYNTNSSKGSDYTSSAWSTKSDGSRWRGKQNKSDISIQEYKNKDRWYITKDEWNSNYARINEILSRNPNSAAAKALANATNETERKAIAQRYATSNKDSYDYMRNLAHGYVPGKKEYASGKATKKTQAAGKKKVDMGASRSEALNRLKGAKI